MPFARIWPGIRIDGLREVSPFGFSIFRRGLGRPHLDRIIRSVVMTIRQFVLPLILIVVAAAPTPGQETPLAEKYLLDGKLAEGAKALESRLQQAPQDDQARFGLGVTQF